MLHQLVKWDFGMQRGEWENVFGSSNLYQAAPLDEVESDAKTQQPGPGVGAISCSLIWICSPFVVCTPDLMQKIRARAHTPKKEEFWICWFLEIKNRRVKIAVVFISQEDIVFHMSAV